MSDADERALTLRAEKFLREHIPSDAPFWRDDIDSQCFRVQTIGFLTEFVEREIAAPSSPPADEPAIPEGMVRWSGGDRAPDDWDGGSVVLRDQSTLPPAMARITRWQHDDVIGDIIAYTPKPPTETDVTARARLAAESIRRGVGGKYDREHERAVQAFADFERLILSTRTAEVEKLREALGNASYTLTYIFRTTKDPLGRKAAEEAMDEIDAALTPSPSKEGAPV